MKRERKLNRKKGYDYSQDGWYFVTTVTEDRKIWFGKIQNNEMKLNEFGEILKQCWFDLPNHYSNCILDEMIIMPNHFHAIIEIDNSISENHGLSEFVRALKTFSSRRINEISKKQFKWQRSFHDRIVKGEKQYINIKNYIINNPINWENDKNNL